MKGVIYSIRFAALLLMTGMLMSCMTGTQLRTVSADPALISGTYTLLLYGCLYPDQFNNVAILVDENSRYPVEIYDIDSSFRVKKGVSAQQAVTEAAAFARCSFHSVWQTQVSRILDDKGGTIGYEFRPLYIVTEFGAPDVMMISYSLRDGIVRAYIRKIRQVEDRFGGDRDTRDSDRHH